MQTLIAFSDLLVILAINLRSNIGHVCALHIAVILYIALKEWKS